MSRRTSPSRVHMQARARETTAWPTDDAPKRYIGTDAVRITKALIWRMRDRGLTSPADLRGCTRDELELAAMSRAKRTSCASFEDALAQAMAAGWIEAYESGAELLFLPNYRHGTRADR